MTVPLAPALFVTPRGFLEPGGGGVQWCTREYLSTLAAAGFVVREVAFDVDRSPGARLRRRLRPRPYTDLIPSAVVDEIAVAAKGVFWCFLNNTLACSLAPQLRKRVPGLRLVFLSHGVELTDLVNNLRLAPDTMPAHQRTPDWLGRVLQAEIDQRRSLDAVVTISAEDQALEQWLGAPSTLFLPRQIPADDLDLAPHPQRVGCAATLNHGPNLHGLQELAAALDPYDGIELRLVGGPPATGRDLASRYRRLTYCGVLVEAELRVEAATWRAFANPIFCPARGASTKVATALGWGLPVATTPAGARGYVWDSALLPLPASPADLANLLVTVAGADDMSPWWRAARSVRERAPDTAACGERLGAFLQRIAAAS